MFDTTVLAPSDLGCPEFDPGPGPRWSSYVPDGLLADMLERESGEGSQWERLERIGAWERVVAWAQANQLHELAAFAHEAERDAVRRARERDARQISGEPVAPEIAQLDGLESAAAEISLMLRIAPVTANSRLDDALALTARHPATLAALATGRITLCKARIIAEQTAQLSDAHAGSVEERVLDRAATQTPGQLRRSVRRSVTKADPAALRRRHEAAKRERGVSFWELPDGMAMVSACLPAGEAVGVYGVLDEYARATGGAGDARTLPARRADALVDLVCGSAGYLSAGTCTAEATMTRTHRRRVRRRRSRVRVQVRVTVPFSTLFGLDEQPGELAGYGTIRHPQGCSASITTSPAVAAARSQPHAVATGALDRQHQPRTRGMLNHPGQRFGVTGAVVCERAGGDHRAARARDLDLIEVPVSVYPDDSVHHFRQHGHRPDVLPVGNGQRRHRPGYESPKWHICEGSRLWADRLLISSCGPFGDVLRT